jgi:antirestriction protein ArdC
VPRPEAYFEPINWHRTALHELGHWSGHPPGLGATYRATLAPRCVRAASAASKAADYLLRFRPDPDEPVEVAKAADQLHASDQAIHAG